MKEIPGKIQESKAFCSQIQSKVFWKSTDDIHSSVFLLDFIWPLTKILKLMGYIVVSKHSNISSEDDFFFTFYSRSTLYSVGMQIFYVLICFGITVNSFLITNWVVYTLLFTGIFYGNVIILAAWLRVKPAVNMLNEWHIINQQFMKSFGLSLKLPKLQNEVRRYTLLFFVIPLFNFALLGTVQVFLTGYQSGWATTILLLRVFGIFYMTMGTMAMQLLYILSCHIMSQIYREIHDQICGNLANVQADKMLRTINICQTIHKWKSMILVLRNQLKNLSDFFSPSDLTYLVIKVISISTAAYTLLQAFSKSSENDKSLFESSNTTYSDLFAKINSSDESLLTPLMLVCMAWITIFVSVSSQLIGVYFAGKNLQVGMLIDFLQKHHQILGNILILVFVFKYDELIETLTKFDTTVLFGDAKVEFKAFLNDLRQMSCGLMYYGTIRVDKNLILLIVNASITYLIILLQFKPL